MVCRSVTVVSPAKTAELIELRAAVWVEDLGGRKEPCITWGAHYRNLANTIEPSMRPVVKLR